jgi:hypothetical protein
VRFAQPDAECPRCDHEQPPSDTPIVTCRKCGLVFTPKERQRSTKAKPDALALVQPRGLVMRTVGGELAYLWSETKYDVAIVIASMSLLTLFVWASGVSLFEKLGFTGFLLVLTLFAAVHARRRARVRIDGNKLYGQSKPLLLLDIRRIDADCGRLVVTDRYDKTHEIVQTSDHEIVAFIADDLAKRLGFD